MTLSIPPAPNGNASPVKPPHSIRVLVDDGAISAARESPTSRYSGPVSLDPPRLAPHRAPARTNRANDLRRYYQMPDGTLIVVRTGHELRELRGQVVDCLIGWDVPIGETPDRQAQRRTKVTIFKIFADGPHYDHALSAIRNRGSERRFTLPKRDRTGRVSNRPRPRHVSHPAPMPTRSGPESRQVHERPPRGYSQKPQPSPRRSAR